MSAPKTVAHHRCISTKRERLIATFLNVDADISIIFNIATISRKIITFIVFRVLENENYYLHYNDLCTITIILITSLLAAYFTCTCMQFVLNSKHEKKSHQNSRFTYFHCWQSTENNNFIKCNIALGTTLNQNVCMYIFFNSTN